MRIIYLTLDDWEGVYINGQLHDEGHHLGEGNNFFYLLELSEKLGFKRLDIIQVSAMDELCKVVESDGGLPLSFHDIAHWVDWGEHTVDLTCTCVKKLSRCCDSIPECPQL
jgi:hypothetical protein